MQQRVMFGAYCVVLAVDADGVGIHHLCLPLNVMYTSLGTITVTFKQKVVALKCTQLKSTKGLAGTYDAVSVPWLVDVWLSVESTASHRQPANTHTCSQKQDTANTLKVKK